MTILIKDISEVKNSAKSLECNVYKKKKKLELDDANQWRCSLKDGSLGLGASGSVIIFKKKKVHTVFVALVIRNS